MESWITLFTAHGKAKGSFPTSCKQSYPQFQKTASYTHSHNADYYGISLIPYIFLIVNIEFVKDKCYNTPVQIRQNERGELMRTNKKRKNEVQLHAKPVEATFAWSNNSR